METLASVPCQIYNYADDSRLILCLEDSARAQVQACNILRFITSWMGLNALKLNPDKTELLVVWMHVEVCSELFWPPEMGSSPVLVPSVKILGLTFGMKLYG